MATEDWAAALLEHLREARALWSLPEALRDDRSLAALEARPWTYAATSERLRGDRAFALLAVAKDGYNLRHASSRLRADREVVLTAVRQEGRALASASPELRADREVVLAAVRQNGQALADACDELRADAEIAQAAAAAPRACIPVPWHSSLLASFAA
jgi:hypothetical protein